MKFSLNSVQNIAIFLVKSNKQRSTIIDKGQNKRFIYSKKSVADKLDFNTLKAYARRLAVVKMLEK